MEATPKRNLRSAEMYIVRAAASNSCMGLAFFLALLVSAILPAQDRDVAAEFKSAKSSLTQQLKDKKKENRIAAVRKLETFPTPDSAKLLLYQGLSSSDEDVRRASFDVLAKFNGDKEV